MRCGQTIGIVQNLVLLKRGSMPTMKWLFWCFQWSDVERSIPYRLKEDVDTLNENELLSKSTEDLCKYFVGIHRIDIPILNRDEIVVDQWETQIDVTEDVSYNITAPRQPSYVPGIRIEIKVPFTGDAEAFKYRLATSLSISMPVTMNPEALIFVITGKDLTVDQVREEIDSTLDAIDKHLTELRRKANELLGELNSTACQYIEQRKERLLENRNLVESLGFKLKERDDSSRTYTPPEVRRKIKPSPPQANSEPEKLEPALDEVDYEHILGVIENMVEVMERSPDAFSDMGEEVLRSHFLVQLNGHYEGQATGETFNYKGKTDILIRSEGKNIFIAECKYWRGPRKLNETINQLLGYTSWRDTKVAVIVFNQNKDFTRVLDSIRSTTKEHPNYKRELNQRSETSFRFIFSHRDDMNREMTLTVMAFDLPK